MIDFDDVGDVVILGGGGSGCGPVGFLLFVVLVVALFCIALSNSNECEQKYCPNRAAPRLMNHSCLCVQEAR